MTIAAICMGRAHDLVRSGSFEHVGQLRHQLKAEGHDINDLNDRGLARGLALRRMFLSRRRVPPAIEPTPQRTGIRHAKEVIDDFKIVLWSGGRDLPAGSQWPLRKE